MEFERDPTKLKMVLNGFVFFCQAGGVYEKTNCGFNFSLIHNLGLFVHDYAVS